MNVGDKVRLLRGNEEGIITKISQGGRIEVEIEDGFRIPAMRNEIVVVSEAERQYFGDGKVAAAKPIPVSNPTAPNQAGLFLGYVPLNDKDHSLYFINNTDSELVYSISEEFGDQSLTLSAGLSAPHS